MGGQKRVVTKSNFKFSMIWLTWWEELVFVPDESIKVNVVPINAWWNKKENMVEYQWKMYSLSWFVKEFHPNRNPSWAYQWSDFFKFNWKILNELRDIKEGKEPKKNKSNIPPIVVSNVTKILKKHKLENDNLLRGIVGAIISNWWIANYTKEIYPFIQKYYPDIYKPYKDNFQWFRWLVNAKLQRYTKWMTDFSWIEIFIPNKKWSWTYYVKWNDIDLWDNENLVYHFRKKRAEANLIVLDWKFIVKKWAKICPDITSNIDTIKNKRKKLENYINKDFITTNDIRFSTPSWASQFVYWATTNWRDDRVDDKWNSLWKNMCH